MSGSDESKELNLIDSMRMNGEVDLMLKESIRQEDLEFEWVYGDPHYPDKHPLTKEIFINLKHKLDASTQYTDLDETNSLDVRCEFINKSKSVMSNIRATVSGLQQIKQYCSYYLTYLLFNWVLLSFSVDDSSPNIFILALSPLIMLLLFPNCLFHFNSFEL